MAERLVVADASPLIGLAAAEGFELLRRLFGQITVTTHVRDEVLAGGELPGASELAGAIRDGWLKVDEHIHPPPRCFSTSMPVRRVPSRSPSATPVRVSC